MKTLQHLQYKLIASVIFTLLIACNPKTKSDKDHLVFRYNEYKNINSLDPAFAKDNSAIWACNQLFNGLVQLDDYLNIQPDIAKSWTVSEDAKTYTFNLRNDVFFHEHKLFKNNKRAVTAFDFEYSFDRLTDEKTASPGSNTLQQVSVYKAVNDSVFTIQLKQPFPAFLGVLTTKYCSVLRKNKNYHEQDSKGNKLPYLEAVAISFLTDKQSEFLQFSQGNIDFISGLDPSYKDELLTSIGKLRHKYTSSVNMVSGDYLNTEYLGFYMDTKQSEIQSALIRKAINYGFDRKTMIKYLRNGIGTPAENGFIPKGLPSFNNLKGFTYQPEKAKELVNQFKKETGITVPKITIATNSNYVDLCEYIQRELEKIGLTVTIDLLTSSTLKEGKSKGTLPVFRASWVADYPDAENYLSLFYSKNFTPNGPNYTHFKNDRYDSLYENALKEVDLKKRHHFYQQMDSIVINNAPVIPLYYDQVIRFSRKNIYGLGINPINLLHLKRVSKK